MTQPSVAVSAGFLAIVATLLALGPVLARHAALAAGAEPAAARRHALRAFVLGGLILAVEAVLALSGFLRDYGPLPPRLAVVVAPMVIGCVLLTLSPAGGRLAAALPAAVLVGFQAFRVPMELVLHRLHAEGVIPVQMTYLGLNFDVLAGLTALPIAWLAAQGRLPRWGLVAWNLAGLALLLNIVTIAILSTPYPFRRFMNEPANTVVFSWPFVWLPGFVVPMALLGHLLCLRKTLAPRGA